MPQQFRRSDRVAGLLRRELAQLIQMQVKDPDLGFISVSDVEVSRDLAHAKVYITVFESDRAASSIQALKKARGFLRSQLGQSLRMRSVPELHFLHDDSVETGAKMDRLISVAVASDGDDPGEGNDPEPDQVEKNP
mgnify:CR=1 FL=1